MSVYEDLAQRYAELRRLPPGTHYVYVHRLTVWLARAGRDPCSPPHHWWITLHPSDDPDHYVRVCIRMHPDGTAHVVSGSGLRGSKTQRRGGS